MPRIFDLDEVRKSQNLLPVNGIGMNPECQSILLMSRRCVLTRRRVTRLRLAALSEIRNTKINLLTMVLSYASML